MAKKVKGADGKVYKVKKPFYKRVWFWVLAVIIIIGIGNALTGNDNTSDTQESDTSQTQTAAKSSSTKTDTKGKITRSQFDAIKIGDLMNNASDGDTLTQLTARFGKPESTTSSTTNDIKTDVVTWTNVVGGWGANVIVSFTNDHAFGKNLTGFKLTRKQTIRLSDFEGFTNGTKFSDFTAKWGQPDYYDETLIGGQTTIIAGYTSGVKGDLGANFNVTFTNNALSGKSQTEMK